jgi:FkbM family methyltransferase
LINDVELRGDIWWPKGELACYKWTSKEIDIPAWVSSHTDKKSVIVQAGGNAGWYAKLYSEIFDRVYVFEPEYINFICLNLNVPFNHVIKIQACLGDKRELVKVKSKESDRGKTHVVKSNKNNIPANIPTLMIDDLNLDECSVIHLDVEGYELFALRGARNTIEKFKPLIALENRDHWLRYNVTTEEINDFLKSFGYKVIDQYREEIIYSV